MRINAGKFRGKKLKMTNLDTTRETSDKVRQAIFNMIGQFFDDAIVLDLFGGSGAMGIEAYSRGASKVVINDLEKNACLVIKENVASLNSKFDFTILNYDYKAAIIHLQGKKFDIIFLDPPYHMKNVSEILNLLSDADLLKEEGYIVFEMSFETPSVDEIGKYELIKEKKYGIKKVLIYQVKRF